ncbi:MAG: ribosomal protein S18-alanine N-acetyltransferase [Bryobacteraceae bacterium]
MSAARIKTWVFRLAGKEQEAVVVSFLSGEPALAQRMAEEVRGLVPERRHFSVEWEECPAWTLYRKLRKRFRRFRIGLAPVLCTGDAKYRSLRLAAFLLAPRKILAYNARLERHHLRLRSLIASWLFLCGKPLDRIFLRPRWVCPWKKDRSEYPDKYKAFEGRAVSGARRRVAVLTPYLPWPLSHGGAVRIFSLLREMWRSFDVFLFAFGEGEDAPDAAPLTEFCAQAIVVAKPRYREPRWSTLLPPEVCEFDSPLMRRLLAEVTAAQRIELRQVEYTYLAPYGGDILVEHDVTFDLFSQVHARRRSAGSWWDLWRWRRFEKRAVQRFRRVAVMSEKDSALLGISNARIVANGVDLERFHPAPEQPGRRLLFIGSFRHFPNIEAFRFFEQRVWPVLRPLDPDLRVTVVAGPDPVLHWQRHTGTLRPPEDERIRMLGFVADVRPLYAETNLALVPTLESAGTNVKVLEALAMERAVVSTGSGCAGLGLEHGVDVWIVDEPQAFADGIRRLLDDADLRLRIARAGRSHVERAFDWKRIGKAQRSLVRELLGMPDPAAEIRSAVVGDLPAITQVQRASPEAAQWPTDSYLAHDCRVAVEEGRVAGFLVSRQTAPGEREILNLAVAPDFRGRGVGLQLVRQELASSSGEWFLEVRQSNQAARNLYRRAGFQQVGIRQDYYHDPAEPAILMSFFS